MVGPACRVIRVNKGPTSAARVPLLQDVLQMPRGTSWLGTPQDDLFPPMVPEHIGVAKGENARVESNTTRKK